MIKKEKRGKLSRGVFLQHDNARPHTNQQTRAAIEELWFKLIPHPPYIPDLTQNDYWLFAKMKEPLIGRKYDDMSGLACAVSQWVRKTLPEFYAEEKGKLPGRWQKCVQLKGGDLSKKFKWI